ncbi:response regulator transcription factor [Clostridium aciditolerans]|uniref:Stage 0 sporulation protein A homolog n=1 Tax=Clostridium aciditolerans TaxID=339861 RepID=A0A934HSN1_9CLOT|nr:response regulator transcription factor [Clostridium aciditolerans]MBI6872568.1 response regulator transcription factor [Clostridium aciditolerans]
MAKTILIVDDEERMRVLIEAYLKKEGFNVLHAENGEEALTVFKSNAVDLVVLDIMMPIMDGWTTCRELRRISNVPIIMLTAKSEDEDQLLGFSLGTDSYVTKPFSPKILAARIVALLKRVYPENNKEINSNVYDGLYINEQYREVKIDDVDVYLSPKEYELLCYLVKNKDLVLSREKILDSVWGLDYYGDLRTVDTHIKRLREKLAEKAYLVATVRGVGYKFEVKK